MPRKRPTPAARAQGWARGKGMRGRGGQSPGEPRDMAGRGVLGVPRPVPAGSWHHPGIVGRGTRGTEVQETQLTPGNPSPPRPDPGRSQERGPRLVTRVPNHRARRLRSQGLPGGGSGMERGAAATPAARRPTGSSAAGRRAGERGEEGCHGAGRRLEHPNARRSGAGRGGPLGGTRPPLPGLVLASPRLQGPTTALCDGTRHATR